MPSSADQPSTDLPPLYERWLRDATSAPLGRETRATCNDCAMCAPGEDSTDFFRPDVKCCSFRPLVPGFSVGAALRDEQAAPRLREQIEARVGVTPLGIGPSRVQDLIYQHGKSLGFGRSRALVCPYLVADGDGDGTCGIWRHRNATCATYFCKHDRGATGADAWAAVRTLLTAVEEELSWHCAIELEVGSDALAALAARRASSPELTDADLDGVVDDRAYRAMWSTWAGREEIFYQRSADLVDSMSWRDVARICGPTVEARKRTLLHAQQIASADSLPERLVLAELRVRVIEPESVRVESYSPSDPLDMPRVLFDSLRRFDGGPTDDSLAAILEHDGVELDESLVQSLVDFRILVTERD